MHRTGWRFVTHSQDSAATLITCYTLRLDYTTITTMHIILIMSCCKTQCTLTQDFAAHSHNFLHFALMRLDYTLHIIMSCKTMHWALKVLYWLHSATKNVGHSQNFIQSFAMHSHKYLTHKKLTKTQGSLSCKPLWSSKICNIKIMLYPIPQLGPIRSKSFFGTLSGHL